jgi:hypothetical protein
MLGNLKIFTIALLMRTLLGRRFNVLQYEALFLLVAGEGGCVRLLLLTVVALRAHTQDRDSD